MKGREWERLAGRQILPALGPGWIVKGSLVYRVPVEHVELGIQADTMYEATRLSLESVVMPLYQQTSALTYFVPKYLDTIDVVGEDLTRRMVKLFVKAVPFLKSHATPALLLADDSWKRNDPVFLEVEAYSLLLAGQVAAARAVLERVAAHDPDPELEWEQEIVGRVHRVLALLEVDVELAVDQLVAWEDETLANLRLERDPP
jgi:hypothetical protein